MSHNDRQAEVSLYKDKDLSCVPVCVRVRNSLVVCHQVSWGCWVLTFDGCPCNSALALKRPPPHSAPSPFLPRHTDERSKQKYL